MTQKLTSGSLFLILLFSIVALSRCRKDEFNNDPAFRLAFSTDTVMFDTVFTTIGSSTQSLVVRNNSSNKINISKISLARGKASPFRINIDGTAAEEYSDLEIGPNDSAYIFIKVTIDPNNANTPMVETDSIVFETNGQVQDVKLVAWGQDAYFHLNTTLNGNVTLPADKPHVVYGVLTAGNGCVLNINAGTRMYFHNGSSLQIRKGATLHVEGTLEAPVIFTGDRLEEYYLDKPGLWDGIWLENGSLNNNFTYAEITNAKVGIQADGSGLAEDKPLQLHNCMINNMTNYGIRATGAGIVATNCQVTNCGGNVVSIENGGNYDFRNCTLARYFSGKGYPAVSISNYFQDSTGKQFPGALTGAYFGNCIITGNQYDEIALNELKGTPFVFQFDYCLVNWEKEKEYEPNFINCIFNKDVNFVNVDSNNFQLDTLSFAIDAASSSIINATVPDIKLDRKGVSRLVPGPPDLGAYERVERK